jgi:sulfotransferase
MAKKKLSVKTIHFLGGLPRSGNNLLSALLNQNPETYCSPLSPLATNLATIDYALKTNEESQIVNFELNTTHALQEFVQGFYKKESKSIIIDRFKLWGNKQSVYLASKYISPEPKIIFTVRDIPSILTSFLTLIKKDSDNYVDTALLNSQIVPYGEQTLDDLRCNWLMQKQIEPTLVALTEAFQINVSICLVEYDDIINDPQKELNKISDFLELSRFKYNFENIEKLETEDLSIANLPIDLHNVRKTVNKISLNPKDVLTPISLKKYSDLEFWRK